MLRIWKSPGDFSPKTLSMMLTLLFAAGFMWFADTQVASASGITVTKTAHISPVITGEVITFTVNITHNVFPVPAMKLNTIDPLAPDCNEEYDLSNFASPIKYDCTMTVMQTDDFTNTIIAQIPNLDGTVEISDTGSAKVDVIHAAIAITKTTDTPIVIEGDTVTFTIEVENTGATTLTNVSIIDPFVSSCIPPLPTPTTPITLGPGDDSQYSCVVATTHSITNVAQVTATVPSVKRDITNMSAFVPIQVVSPTIQITKTTATPIVIAGDMATFTIEVKNTGDITLTNVIISDTLVTSCGHDFGELGPGQSAEHSCEGTVTDNFTNVADVSADVPTTISRSITSEPASVSIQAVNPEIQITKMPANQTVNEGGTATFTIAVTNTGDITLTHVIISDTLVPSCNRTFLTLGPQNSILPYSCEVLATDSFTNVAQVDAIADISIPRSITPSMAQAAVTVIPSGQDPICVEGIVINHKEQLVAGVPVFARLDKGTPPIPTTSDDKGKFNFDIPLPGKWIFSLDNKKLPSDWLPVIGGIFNVDLEAGQDACYQIRFKIKRVRQVIVNKFDDAYTPLPDWIIKVTPGIENNFAEVITATTDISGTAIFTLTEGLWTFTEEAPLDSDISYIPIIPKNGIQDLTIDVTRPYTDPYKISFKNRIISEGACIDIHKKDVPQGFGIQGWYMEVLRMDGTLAAMGYTDIEGNLTIEGLPSGPYTIVEENRLGWAPVSSPRVDVTVIAGAACKNVTFTNRQDPPGYCVEGRKIDINGGYGLPDWEITIKPVAENGFQHDRESVMTDGIGRYRFDFPDNDYRIPGSAYEICEVQQGGWVTAFTPECRVVYLPQVPGACVQIPDFVNAQVGHDLTQYYTPTPTALPPQAPSTPMPPTATPTAIPTNTASPLTATLTPYPTATPTNTLSPPTATLTPYPTATNTLNPPTAIPTPYPTATPTEQSYGQQSSGGGNPADPTGKLPPGSKAGGASSANNGPAYTQTNSHDPECQSYHIVQPGEGLSTIASRYGLYHRDMLRCNGWVSAQKNGWVYPGQRLCVPYH